MHTAIVGGTGFIGTALAERLIDEHEVTVIARTPADATLPAGVDRVAADVTDPGTLEGVFAAVDVVVNLVALSPLFTPAGATCNMMWSIGRAPSICWMPRRMRGSHTSCR
jgi:Nucleoside-diphosphate-sugar epimerases